jgi:ATP-binding cassette, subfamily B, bacterial
MSKADLQRDKKVTREIHRLFWRANRDRPLYLVMTILLYPPAMFLINVLIPLMVAFGIQAIIKGNYDDVTSLAWLIVGSMFVSQIIFTMATIAFDRLGTYAGSYVQKAIFSNYLNKDYDFYSNQFIGGLGAQAARVRDAIEEYDRIMLFELLKASVIIIAGLVVMATLSIELAAFLLLGVVIILAGTVYIAMLRLKYRRELSQASNQLASVLGDSLSHGPTVKSYAKESYELDRMAPSLNRWVTAQLKTWDSSIPHTFLRHMLLAVIMAFLLIVSANLYRDGAITIATIALVQLYVIRIANVTLDIGDNIKKYEGLMSNAYEPVATMMIPTVVNDPAEPVKISGTSEYEINFKNVVFHYPEAKSKQNAVNKFNLKVKPGEKIGLVGFSGGGKTTITKLLMRFMDVTEGSITINGIDLREVTQDELRSKISYVPQEPLLFHRSIGDNILYSKPDANQKEFARAATTAYIEEYVDGLPKKYETLVGERGVKLSGGQRQRVAVARALLKDAPILVLDEATSALDSQSEQFIQKALWELMKDRTAIVIAHRLSTIQRMDRIIVMDKGEIVQSGSHKELLDDTNGIYAKLWSHQSGGYLVES